MLNTNVVILLNYYLVSSESVFKLILKLSFLNFITKDWQTLQGLQANWIYFVCFLGTTSWAFFWSPKFCVSSQICRASHKYFNYVFHILISEIEIMPVLSGILKEVLKTETIWDEQDLLFTQEGFISDDMSSLCPSCPLEGRGRANPHHLTLLSLFTFQL